MRNNRERSASNEETDFIEVIQVLWRQKLLVLLTMLVVSLLAITYAFKATPIYEARVFVLPPSQNDISPLNFGRGQGTDLGLITVKEVYDTYLRNLQSEMLRRGFFRNVYLPSLPESQRNGSQDELYNRFNAMLTVTLAGKDSLTRYAITVSMTDPHRAADWLTRFIQLVGDRAKQDVLQDVKGDAAAKADNIQQQIDIAQDSARKQREDQIARLEEALKVAKSMGLEKPPVISGSLADEVSGGMDGALTYMRGSKALEAEIGNLLKRGSDDPFIGNLRQQQAELKFYRGLTINPASVAVFRQDGGIDVPDKPVKPKKTLIILVGLLAGALLGVLLAMLRHFWGESLKARRAG